MTTMTSDRASLEAALRRHWRALGWRLATKCSVCGEVTHCAGRDRRHMICFPCWDLTPEAEHVAEDWEVSH